MIVAVIILGVVLVGLWMYMRRTKPHTAVDEEARQEGILKRRMESKASRAEVDRLEQIAQGKKDIEELEKPFVGAPMPNYDPSQIEQDPKKRTEKIRKEMGVDSGERPVVENPNFHKNPIVRAMEERLAMFDKHDIINDEYGTSGYDKKTGKLIWVENRLADGTAGEFRYANKDDLYKQELKDFITA